jgi:hypothetical protein
MPTEHQFNDRLIRFPELEKIFGVCKRTVRRRAKNGELPPLPACNALAFRPVKRWNWLGTVTCG